MRGAALLLALAACGDDGTGPPQGGDAPPAGDAPLVDARLVDAPPDAPRFVFEVTCPGTPDADITTNESPRAFTPATASIPLGGIVRFSPGGSHNVAPVPPSDPGLQVGFGQTRCLQFTVAGTFNFRCSPHPDMTGTITVVGP